MVRPYVKITIDRSLKIAALMLAFSCAAAAQNLQPFAATLAEIQNAIAKADGLDGYYRTTYRPSEMRYWAQIPQWMQQDAGTRDSRLRTRETRILDIGCGYGTLLSLATQIYANARGSCMDMTEYIKPIVRSRYNLEFLEGNVELDPIPGGPYDVMILTEVIEHFNFYPLPTVQKMHHALAPGGVLFLSTPDASRWGRLYDFHKWLKDFPMPPLLGSGDPRPEIKDEHMWMYNKGELTGALQDAGFRIVKLAYSPGVRGRHFNIWAVRK